MSDTENQSPQEQPVDTGPAVELGQAPEQAPAASDPPAARPTADKRIVVGQTTSPGLAYDPLLAPTDEELSVDPNDTNTGPKANPNVHLEFDYTSKELPVNENPDFTLGKETVFFFAERGAQVDERIAKHIRRSVLDTPAGRNWNSMLRAAGTMSAYHNQAMGEVPNRKGSEWRQYLATEVGRLGFNVPRVAEEGVGMYRGADAMLRVRSIMGLGGVVSVPLFHSGFWVTLATPTESALIELFRRISDDKVRLGRETMGLVFSNEQSYLVSWLVDFCLEHMRETSLKNEDPTAIRSLMKAQDHGVLLWALACLIWPRGFNYGRALTTVEGVQKAETVTARINVAKLLWVDNSYLSTKQKAHMARRARGSVTEEQVLEYQKEFDLGEGRLFQINDQLGLRLKQPTIEKYVEDGESWISNIVRMVDTTFTQAAPGDDERNRIIDLHAKAARLRKYGSWISAVVFTDPSGAGAVDNTEESVIQGTLEMLSSLPEADQIEKAIGQFIDDTTISMIAIPETSGKDTGIPRFPHLIPLDVVNTFFTLLAQKIDIIDQN